MTVTRKSKPYTDDERRLVEYFKEQLRARGILKFPRDWHLKQLSTARVMLAGPDAPSVDQWKYCIDWCFAHEFWGDKVDHLARVESPWTKYVLQARKPAPAGAGKASDKEREILRRLYLS